MGEIRRIHNKWFVMISLGAFIISTLFYISGLLIDNKVKGMYKEQEALLLWGTKHEKGKIPLWGKTNDISTASAFKEAGMIILEREELEEEIRKKIMSATTDSEMRVYFDEENKKGISNLINIVIAFSDEKETAKTIEERFEGKSYKEFKEYVADILVKKIGKIQEKYNEVITSGILDEILDEGKAKVQKLAQDKYIEMTKKMGLTRS